MLGIKEIQEIIPHRHPFLLVDRIEELVPGEKAVGYKAVTYDEKLISNCDFKAIEEAAKRYTDKARLF